LISLKREHGIFSQIAADGFELEGDDVV